jgi:SPP1 gp7 family putative phage head morphogenesis protein
VAKGRSRQRRTVSGGQVIEKAVHPSFAVMADSPAGRGTDVQVRPFALMEAIQAATGEVYGQFAGLPRDAQDDSAFGPMSPLVPEAIDDLNGVGRTDPRAFQYQVGWNLPGNGNREVPWQVLRASANGIGVLRRCIEVRKKHVRTLKWVFGVTEDAINDAYEADSSKGKLEAERRLRERLLPEMNRLRQFWRKPWKSNDVDMGQWINGVMEDYEVLDGVAIFPRKTYGGDVYDLEIIDATTIKPLLDAHGRRPIAPHPAFQQILYGFPRGEWTASAEYDEEGNALISNAYAASELYYRRENFRSFSPYGFSPTEMALFDARLYLQRQKWMLAEYDDGSTPLTWIETAESADGKTMTLTQQRLWEKAFNAKHGGQTRERMRAKVLPHGWTPHQMTTVDERYKPEYDLHLIKLLCSYYGVTIAELGFTEPTGLGNQSWHEGQAEVTGKLGLRPDTEVMTDIVNDLSRQFLKMPAELEFRFVDPAAANTAERETVLAGQRTRGTISMNEERQELGQSLLPFAEADMYFLTTPTGPIFLEGAYDRAQQAVEQAKMTAQAQVMGTAGKLEIEHKRIEDGQAARAEGRDFAREQFQAQQEADGATDAQKSAELMAFRNWRRRHPEDEPKRPFIFKFVTPGDGWPELESLTPAVVDFGPDWQWIIEDDLTKSAMSWLEWNAKHPNRPRDASGRWVKASALIHALQDEGKRGKKTGRGVDAPSTVQGVDDFKERAEAFIAEHKPKPITDVRGRVWEHRSRDLFVHEGKAWTREMIEGVKPLDIDAARAELARLEHIQANPGDFSAKENQWANGRIGYVRADIALYESQHSKPDKPTPDELVARARARQASIDSARARAQHLAEIQELRINEATPETIRHRMAASARDRGIAGDPIVAHLDRSLEGDMEGALGTAAAAWGLKRIGDERMVPFVRGEHKMVYGRQPEQGTFTHLVRPGYRFKHGSEDLVIEQALVDQATPDEVKHFKIETGRVPGERIASHEQPKVPKREGGAKRGDLLVAEQRHPDMWRADFSKESVRPEYPVFEITSVTREGKPKMLRDVQWGSPPRPVERILGLDLMRSHVIPGDRVHKESLIEALRLRTYPNSDTPLHHSDLGELRTVILEHVIAEDVTKAAQADDADPKAQPQQPEPVPPDQRWPGWLLDAVIAAIVTEMLLSAMPGLDISALIDSFAHWSRGYRPGDPVPDVMLWIRNLPADVRPDFEAAIRPALRAAHAEGALVGERSAAALIDFARDGGDVREHGGFDIEWDGWTPGHPSAAEALLERGGLERLLYQSNTVIKGIAASRLDELGRVLGRGLANGDAPDKIARDIRRDVLNNPAWAKRVAITETNRAMSWAAVIGYRNAGLKYKGWITAYDQRVCMICHNNEWEAPGVPRIVPIDELFPSGDPWPPAHPHCRCAPIPVFDPFGERDVTKSVMSWLEWNAKHPKHPRISSGRFGDGPSVPGMDRHQVAPAMREGLARVGRGGPLSPDVREQISSAFTGRFGNMATKDVSVKVNEDSDIEIKGLIYAHGGQEVGQFMRTIRIWTDQPPEAHHDWLSLEADIQGQGFAQEFNAHLYEHYRQWGIEEVHLAANIDVGGYAWARAGFDWAHRNAHRGPRHSLLNISPFARLRDFVHPPLPVQRADDEPESWDAADVIPADRLEEQRAVARQMYERFTSTHYGAEDWPTPYELSVLGRWPGAGKDDWWIGKAILMGSSWAGVRKL